MSSIDNNDKLTAVRIITLLYTDYLLGYYNKHTDTAKKALLYVVEPSEALGVNTERDTIVRLKATIEWLISILDNRQHIPKVDFVIQLEQVSQYESWIKVAVMQIVELDPEKDKDLLKHTQETISKELENTVITSELVAKVKDIYKKAVFDKEAINYRDFAARIVETFSPYMASRFELEDANSQGTLNFSEDLSTVTTQITALLEKDRQKRSGNMVLKTGYQCVNTMLRGGPRMGEFIINIAMKFNYKSGLIVNIFRQLPKYNKPFPVPEGKVPTLVFVTFEQDLSALIFMLYAGIIENETRLPLTEEAAALPAGEMAEIVYRYFNNFGWNVVIHHQNPLSWTYEDIFRFTEGLEKAGCRLIAAFFDYLFKVPKTGCHLTQVIGEDVKVFYTRIRAYYKMRDCLIWSPHQMNSSARDALEYSSGLLVENINGLGKLEGCRTIDDVVDVEIYQHIETDKKSNNVALSLMRGKHKLEGEIQNKQDLLVLLWMNNYNKNMRYVSGVLDDVGYGAMHSHKLSDPPRCMSRESVVFDDDSDF